MIKHNFFWTISLLTVCSCQNNGREQDSKLKTLPEQNNSATDVTMTNVITGKWYLCSFFNKNIGDTLTFQRDSCSFNTESNPYNAGEGPSTHTNSWEIQNDSLLQKAQTKSNTIGGRDVWGQGKYKWSIDKNMLLVSNNKFQILKLDNKTLVLIKAK